MSTPKAIEFLIRLRALPNDWQAPEQRLRALLKRALRDYRLKCVDARPAEPGNPSLCSQRSTSRQS